MLKLFKRLGISKDQKEVEKTFLNIPKEKKERRNATIVDSNTCECCKNTVYTYRRKLGYSILKPLTNAWGNCQLNKTIVFHVADSQSMDYNMNSDLAKARYYGIIEKPRDSKHKDNGFWKFTKKGIQFMDGEIKLQEYFVLKNGNLVNFEGEFKSYSELINK
jgi:hypothetical protein